MDDTAIRIAAPIALACIAIFVISIGGCSVNVQSATRALNATGIHDVKFGGYAWFACDKHDTFSSTFTGIGANGDPVSGAVCQGILKNTTVRFD